MAEMFEKELRMELDEISYWLLAVSVHLAEPATEESPLRARLLWLHDEMHGFSEAMCEHVKTDVNRMLRMN